MHLEVAFTLALLSDAERKLCIVVDVLRATSSAVTMFGRGLAELLVAETIGEARRLAEGHPGHLLCGEEGSLPPPGFDFGNSPSEFAGIELTGRRAILATTNGTVALARAAGSPVVLVGAMLNVRAVAALAVREAAAEGLDIAILCSGRNRARAFSLEDTFCAGAILEAILLEDGASFKLADDATAARRLYRCYRGSARAAFREADHSASLVELGLGRDVEFCAERDRFAVVPRLRRDSGGLLRVVAEGG
jgi:2-phosphosulfolactate phosphatase